MAHRLHSAGIYADMTVFFDGIHVTIYSSTMDPSWVAINGFRHPLSYEGVPNVRRGMFGFWVWNV